MTIKSGKPLQDSQDELDEDNFPLSPTPSTKSNEVICMVINKNNVCTAYTNLTGRFPCKSNTGNEYILVAYHFDGNCSMTKAIKNRKVETITAAWQTIHNMYTQAGVDPNTYVMDSEIPYESLVALIKNSIEYQLVPPHTHQRNLAERAIKTFKIHFKAGFASVDQNFSLSEWNRLIE